MQPPEAAISRSSAGSRHQLAYLVLQRLNVSGLLQPLFPRRHEMLYEFLALDQCLLQLPILGLR